MRTGAFECLVSGAFWSSLEFLNVSSKKRSRSLVKLIHISWEHVLLDLCPDHTSSSKVLEDGIALGFAHIKKLGNMSKSCSVESLMKCCLSCSSDTHSCELYVESSETLETLSLLYNAEYRLRERRERQRPGEWYQLGIPGPFPAMDHDEYEPGGKREDWTKAILPNGGYVYRRPKRYALRSSSRANLCVEQ